MDIRKLQRVIVDGLEDVKAQNIAVYNTEHLSALFERVIIASGTSNRQTKSLASSVREAVKEAGFPVPRTEGEGNGEWIIVDCGAAVVHVMQPSIREYYHLEEIWGDKPVKMKMDGNAARLVKAEEPEEPMKKTRAAAKKAPATKVAAKKAVGKLSPAKEAAVSPARKSPAAKKTSPVAGKTAAKTTAKTAAKRVVAKKAVTRTTGVKTPIKMIVVNSPSLAKKADARKAAARGVEVKRPAAKKAPARKTSSRA